MDLSTLNVPFSEEEVWAAIKDIPCDKAPSLDGFTGRFYRGCWNVVKVDIMAALLTLQNGDGRNMGLINSAFLTLLPKKVGTIQAKDFCL